MARGARVSLTRGSSKSPGHWLFTPQLQTSGLALKLPYGSGTHDTPGSEGWPRSIELPPPLCVLPVSQELQAGQSSSGGSTVPRVRRTEYRAHAQVQATKAVRWEAMGEGRGFGSTWLLVLESSRALSRNPVGGRGVRRTTCCLHSARTLATTRGLPSDRRGPNGTSLIRERRLTTLNRHSATPLGTACSHFLAEIIPARSAVRAIRVRHRVGRAAACARLRQRCRRAGPRSARSAPRPTRRRRRRDTPRRH